MQILFSELCKKDVINSSDGSVLGHIIDIETDIDTCQLTSIIVNSQKGLSFKKEHIKIPWGKIEKIGIDVIIVNSCQPICHEKCDKKVLKNFFN